jgi:bacterioferritin-associated ferredoxin
MQASRLLPLAMIVCICHRVSDRDIQRHVGACASFDELQIETGVATRCGRCGDCAQQVFHEARRGGSAGSTGVREIRITASAIAA